jgi:hypothetical protein
MARRLLSRISSIAGRRAAGVTLAALLGAAAGDVAVAADAADSTSGSSPVRTQAPSSFRSREGRTTYRNGTVVAVISDAHRMAIDVGGDVLQLDVDTAVDLTVLQPGDGVLVGLRDVSAGKGRAVLVRPALGSPVDTPDALTSTPASPAVSTPARSASSGDSSPTASRPRRPMRVVPNPSGLPPGKESAPAARVPTLVLEGRPEPSEKALAVAPADAAETTPAAAAPSALDTLRQQGGHDLESALKSLDRLVDEADRLWLQYARGCLGSDVAARAWLSRSSAPSAGTDSSMACQELRLRVERLATLVRQHLDDAEEHARAGSVTPGAVRELLDKYELRR